MALRSVPLAAAQPPMPTGVAGCSNARSCHRQFSATCGTLLPCHKLPFRTLLMAFSLFVNAVAGGKRAARRANTAQLKFALWVIETGGA
jgi:hypothetical protein